MICHISSTCRAGHRCELASELKHNQTLKIHYFDSILFQMLLSWVRSVKYSSMLWNKLDEQSQSDVRNLHKTHN